ncbi:MAG: alkaline phosphatase D family protein [Bacteroidota bacterium]
MLRLALLALLAPLLLPACSSRHDAFESTWADSVTRDWVGPHYWANRLQDWRVENGQLVCVADQAGNPMRNLHLLTHRLGAQDGSFGMRVQTGPTSTPAADSSATVGFQVGAGRGLDYRGASLIFQTTGRGAGIFAGVHHDGRLLLRDLAADTLLADIDAGLSLSDDLTLELQGIPEQGAYRLVLTARRAGDEPVLAQVRADGVPGERLEGNVALHTNRTTRWFDDWQVGGGKITAHPDDHAGPILFTQYTLHQQKLKLSAQLMPVSPDDAQQVRLETYDGTTWTERSAAPIIMPGYIALFEIEGWDDTMDTPYRVAYDWAEDGVTPATYTYEGTIRRDPVDQQEVSVAGFTGNHNVARGFGRAGYDFLTNLWFPHVDVVTHVQHHNPDLLFFSGDQIYEGGSPSWADRSGNASSYTDLLYKWYLWGWAFRDITRDRPTITIPDDHDVYQGNLWGQRGRPTDKDDKGGYEMPAEWVKMSERMQTSHLPDPYMTEPIEQGIGTYFTEMTYGRVGIAILEDRKFKTGPAGLIPGHQGRADHIQDPNFDPDIVDRPGLELLGPEQEQFLSEWAADWHEHDMKLAVSQTVFAGLATHHGPELFRLLADLDSNGWPMRGRNRALAALRKGFAFMLAGDQHLATLVQHGIDDHGDAGWSFAVPSIANFYPRAWMPEVEGGNRPPGAGPEFGDHVDGLRNKITMHAHTNPTGFTGISTGQEPLELHDKMPGYGIVRFDKTARTITVENWPRYSDPAAGGAQYEGWPRTIAMEANYDREPVAYLSTLEITGLEDAVVQVIEERTGEIVYTLRIDGTTYRPKVFAMGSYTIRVGEPDAEGEGFQTIAGIDALPPGEIATLPVTIE